LRVALVLLWVLLIAISVFAPHPVLWRSLFALLATLLFAQAWWQLARLPSALRLYGDGRIEVADAAADFVLATCLPAATVHPWLCVLRLKIGEKKLSTVVLTVDSLDREDFRRLRVFLRWRLTAAAA